MKYTYDVESYEHAYLRISNDDLKAANISNPFDDMTDWQKDNFHLHVLSIMRDTRYMHWTIKHLLNVDLLPQQVVILQELWVRSFPMYIASRGYGKSFLLAVYATLRCLLVPESKIVIVGAAFRQSKVIFEYMDVIWKNAPLLRSLCSESSGPRRDVDRCTLRINDSWTIAVPLGDGCLVRDSLITYDNTVDTISVEHDTGNPDQEVVNRKRNVWGNGLFRESDESYCNGVKDTKKIVTQKGYTIEGTLNHTIKVYNKLDLSIEWKRFDEISVGDFPIIDRSERWHDGVSDLSIDEGYFVGAMMGDGYAKDKTIPHSILSSSKDVVAACISGLYDTDGYVQVSTLIGGTSIVIGFTNTSERLLEQLQYLLLHFGIISHKTQGNRDKNWNTVYELLVTGKDVRRFHTKINFRLSRKKNILAVALSDNTIEVGSEDVIPGLINDMLYVDKIQGRKEATRDRIESFCSTYYIAADPIVETIQVLNNPDIYYDEVKSITDGRAATYDIHIPDQHEYCANGFFSHNTKIRGLRAHTVIADEFNCLDGDTLVETTTGLVRIGDNNIDHSKIQVVTGDDDHPYETPDKYIITPPTDVYEIKFNNGYVIKCSKNHPIKTIGGWKTPLELDKGDLVESFNHYKFPTEPPKYLDEKAAWLLGMLVSEGAITTIDKKLSDKLQSEFGLKCILRRGWNGKLSYHLHLSLDLNKKTPGSILQANKSCLYAYLEGLFEGNGSCFSWGDDNRLGVVYRSASEVLCRDVHVLLNKLGYDPSITGPGDSLQWFVRMNGHDAYRFVSKMNIDRFNTFIANCYVPKATKKIHTRYREVVSVTKLDHQEKLYDYHLPITHSFYAGTIKNHNSIPVEIYETVVAGFASVHKDPAENVKEAFRRNAMKADNVWTEFQEDSYKSRHKNQSILSGTAGYDFEPYADYWRVYKKMIKGEGYDSEFGDDEEKSENEKNSMPEYMERLNREEFSVIRIPYELIPEGFMDDQQVSRSRATMHSGIFIMEYGACFAKDSQGFFKRTLIEGATATDKNLSKAGWPRWCDDPFEIITKGRVGKQYVFGIDPASENDNFAVVIIELHPEHHRIAYVWTTNKKDFGIRKKLGLTESDDYYGFCVRKIRDLYRLFPCVGIGIDSQGGGYVIAEGLRDKDKMLSGERPILPIINEKKEVDTDLLDGDHIIELIQFASAEWTSKANHGLRKDMEDKVLLFPRFDNVTLSLVSEHDKIQFKKLKERLGDSPALKLYDTLEDCVMEVEELKTELSTITMSRTASGRERFDTPEIKLKTGKKGRMRKDRYSALVIVNMLARSIQREITPPAYVGVGRIAQVGSVEIDRNKPMYVGPQQWASYSPKAVRVIRSN